MKTTFFKTTVALIAMLAFCISTHAGTTPAPKASPTPALKQKPDAISAVSADSITVEHTKIKRPTSSKEKATEETSTKTYKIIPTTEIVINGETAKVDALKTGMVVSVTSETSTDPKADKSIAGIATRISAKSAVAAKK